jgi:hypothetical protein
MAQTDERPSMDGSAAIRGAADIGGLAVGGQDIANDPSQTKGTAFCCDARPTDPLQTCYT